ncbi:MAG: glutamyl-tRNA reductase [Sandaracinaceae bacterium]|nr:glutamyl-tRNA reductase [Sandaracinaceae bacterium]
MKGELFVVGLSHRTAPLAIRERLAVSGEKLAEDLSALSKTSTMDEALLISTCNRVEVYASASDIAAASREVRNYLNGKIAPDAIDGHLYERVGTDAVKHAFRVASSLDSMILGEPQILGQVKTAYATAHAAGTLGTLLSRCFHRAFAVAKRVRTETGVAAGTVSVSSIACELAKKIFGDLHGRRVLLLGAGKMSETAARHLRKQGAQLYIVNRSPERAEELARVYGGIAKRMEDLAHELTLADVAITSTSSPDFVITRELMQSVQKARRHRLMLLVDIAVPRDVDPRVGTISNVILYDIDDLEKVSGENLAERLREASVAEQIVEGEVREFEEWRRSLVLTPTIVALRETFQQVVRDELARTTSRLSLREEDKRALERMGEAIVTKLLHQPLQELKRGAEDSDGAEMIAAVRKLFDLETSTSAQAVSNAEAAPAAASPQKKPT